MPEVMRLSHQELSLLCVLMLRGSQTPGELRSNGSRLYDFISLEEVEQTLNGLITRDDPLVVRLPRQPGQKEVRFVHLLSGQIDVETYVEPERISPVARRAAGSEQMDRLEEKVEALKAEVERLRGQFDEFRKQFE